MTKAQARAYNAYLEAEIAAAAAHNAQLQPGALCTKTDTIPELTGVVFTVISNEGGYCTVQNTYGYRSQTWSGGLAPVQGCVR